MASHSGHAHHAGDLSDARLVWAILLNLGLSLVELVVGLISGSLALVADAAHNFNDCLSLVVTLVARIISRTKADHRRTFGYRRAEVIGAFINLLLLIVIGFFLLYEAGVRYFHPQPILAWPMIIAASVALVVDLATVGFLHAMAKGSINLRAGFLHKVSDTLASVGVILGGVVILLKEWYFIDLIVTVVIATYILWQSFALLKPTIAILMESVPTDVSLGELNENLSAMPGVVEVHHVHIWELDEAHRALEAHVVIEEADVCRMEAIKQAIKNRLCEHYRIHHSTLEFEISGTDCSDPSH